MSTGEIHETPAVNVVQQQRADGGRSLGDPQREVYTHGYSPQVAAYMGTRTASRQAHFILRHLRVGMRVLDCGCGPGSITADVAAAIAPGQVEGIDIGPTQIAAARQRAVERGLTNVHFQVGSMYDLPFPTSTFDVVFANTVVQHLRYPQQALREMRRVLAPGGIIGLRDDDWGTCLLEPSTPLMQLFHSLTLKVWTHNGGDPFIGRKYRQLVTEAGFVRSQASSSSESYGSVEATSAIAAAFVEHHSAPAFVDVVLEQGWADRGALEAMYQEIRNWGKREDAFWSLTFCEVIGWKPEDPDHDPDYAPTSVPV